MVEQTTHDQPTDQVAAHAAPPSLGRKLQRWFLRLLTLAVAAVLFGSGGLLILFFVITQELPEIRSLADYKPKQATIVYGKDGHIVARFANERRSVVPFERIPEIMRKAVLAAEDDNFYNHAGLDYLGIARCLVKNTLQRRTVCGGSTITQQTVKTFLLTSKQTYGRKLREMILSKRVEEALPKNDILYLYLNQIYFGHGAYGIQEAARVYFAKDVSELAVEEAALLAGLPQSPSRLDPFKHPERALKRRAYVLRRLRELEQIDQKTHDEAKASPLRIDHGRVLDTDLDSSTHYAAHVKSELETMLEKVGPVSDAGLEVYASIDAKLQGAAEDSIRAGVRDLDKRQGWRGPLFHLELNEITKLRTLVEARRTEIAPSIPELETLEDKGRFQPVVWDLRRAALRRTDDGHLDLAEAAKGARFRRFALEKTYAGIVVEVDDSEKQAVVDLGGAVVVLPLRSGLAWARKFDLGRYTRRPKKPSDVLAKGDVVLVRPTTAPKDPRKGTRAIGVLEQRPIAQAALVAIDTSSREVRALVGGYGSGAGTFNRATQAKRQAGSTFKPFVYAAALETTEFTTISTCVDAPHVYRDPWTGNTWKPRNYDGKFDGEITLRTALTKSKNLCSVWLAHKIGVDKIIDVARRAGITSPLPKSDTLALGSGDVTPLEMVNAYATIASGGAWAQPVFIKKVLSPEGQPLFEADTERRQTIRPEVTYQLTSLMQSVVEDGTAQRVKILGRPVAGKTGTTNEARNAWFIGFTPGPGRRSVGRARRQSSVGPRRVRRTGGDSDLAQLHGDRVRRHTRARLQRTSEHRFCVCRPCERTARSAGGSRSAARAVRERLGADRAQDRRKVPDQLWARRLRAGALRRS